MLIACIHYGFSLKNNLNPMDESQEFQDFPQLENNRHDLRYLDYPVIVPNTHGTIFYYVENLPTF